MEFNDELILIDGNSLINRAYYALPMLTSEKGEPCGAVYGFANMLVRMITEYRPKYVAVAFDMHAPTFRHKMYDGYKATRRGMPDELAVQMPVVKHMLDVMGIKYVEQEGIEADDIIGTLAKSHGIKTFILTGDRDSFQLIDDSTTVLFTKRGISEVQVMDAAALKESMGLTPSQILDFKALAGDTSDNIPGVPGVGEKRALDLLGKYGSARGVYEHLGDIGGKLAERIEAGRESSEMSYKLATIKTDCALDVPLSDMTYAFPFSPEVREFFTEMDFKSLLRRNELFGEGEKAAPQRDPAKIVTLASAGELAVAADGCKEFAVALGKVVSLSADGRLQYSLPVHENLLDTNPTESEILAALRPALEDAGVKKYVYDAKKNIRYLAGFGITLRGYEDVALMEYLAGRPRGASPEGYAETLGMPQDNAAAALMAGAREAAALLEEQHMTGLYRDLELPLVDVLYRMEEEGFLIDLGLLAELKKKFDADEKECAEKIYSLCGKQFNINSPKQLAGVLFDDLGLPYPKRMGTTARGIKSTSAEVLAHIVGEHPVVPEIIRFRYIAKLNATYIDGLGKVAGADGVVHTEFNQMLTSTGRLSSSEPNLQNIPVREDEGRVLRGLFIAREGHRLVSADYSQVELRVMAHLSGDSNLIEAFRRGEDVHTSVARELFGTAEPTARERRTAKTVNFGIIYGMSSYGLSERLSIPPREAKAYIDRYFERFPGVKAYLDGVVAEAKKTGYAESLFGRRRNIPELRAGNYQRRAFGERAAMNMPLQSTAADIIKAAMLRVDAALSGMRARLVLQVHDELIVDAPEDEVDQVADILRREMENAVELSVPLVVEVKSGRSWLECK